NQWSIRHARRLIAERSAKVGLDDLKEIDQPKANMVLALMDLAKSDPSQDDVRRLNVLWTLYVTGMLAGDRFASALLEPSAWVRAWVVRLLVEDVAAKHLGPESLTTLPVLAQVEPSPIVRMALTSVLQKIPVIDRWPIATALAAHAEDASDPYLPLMLWYAVEPMVASDPDRALELASTAKIPLVRTFIARRYTGLADLGTLARLIAATADPAVQADLLNGAIQGLTGRTVAVPPSWAASYAALMKSPNTEVRHRANRLALLLRDPAAIAATRSVVADSSAPTEDRLAAIDGLVAIRAADLGPVLQPLLADRAVRAAALRALASTDHPETAPQILKAYPSLDAPEKADALATLAARPASALVLLGAIASGAIPKSDINPSTMQALAAIGDARVKAAVAKVWASVRPSPAEKRSRIEQLKAELTSDVLARADPSRGRAVFARACASCHTLFDAGGKIGPELTGSQRTNLDYVLTHVVDPSSVVGSAFQVQVFATSDGRVLSGIVKTEDENTFTIQTANDVVLIPKRDLEARRSTGQSLMPEGLLDALSKDEVRDLIGYLASPSQVPVPSGAP
ncbi:MAG TPA: c-type cytochrome, partial [Isosphaeraceae bacterium]